MMSLLRAIGAETPAAESRTTARSRLQSLVSSQLYPLMGIHVALMALWLSPALVAAEQACDGRVVAKLRVDQGHPWRPPFGLDRVGAPLVAHVELAVDRTPQAKYFLIAHGNGHELERRELSLIRNPTNYSLATVSESPRFFAHVPLESEPDEVALYAHCQRSNDEIARQAVARQRLEADAVARPDRSINPVDLGAVLVPHDWLLLAGGQTAMVEVALLSHGQDLPDAKVRAWFGGGSKPVEVALPLARGRRATATLALPMSVKGDRTTLHVSVTGGAQQLWKKDIPTMIVASPPSWPVFGAVETKLRYDAPIAVTDSKTGGILPAIDYDTGWDEERRDVVVFLPNGSRFVFWRGSSYAPFWAGANNTGVSYQWAETTVPVKQRDAAAKDYYMEPLFDKELRYGRVRIVESTPSRVHVRWTYQLLDYRYEVGGDQASEDFYFYPDGFGTRVLTAPNALGTFQQVSEFIIITPQAAYPLEVLPNRILDVLALGGEKGSITFPVQPLVTTPDGETQVSMWSLPVWPLPAVNRRKPTLYRIFSHKNDSAAAIYFHPRDTSPLMFLLPFYDEGQVVTPVYWGNHWPLSRGGWTSFGINDRFANSPGHNSVAAPFDAFWPAGHEPRADMFESIGQAKMPDALGRPREMTIRRWTWLIAQTSLPDAALQEWGKSFSSVPALEVTGARLDFPSFVTERRALRLIAESGWFEIKIKPEEYTVNPVFEIDGAPRKIGSVTLNGKVMDRDFYAWDGAVLWIKATIAEKGATIGVRFQ